MAITEQAKSVIERRLDPARIKTRQGGQGMTFDYIGTEHAIQLLNEAFEYAWDTKVISHEIFDGLAVALIELKVWDDSGNPVTKQQFGSCNINRGVDTGAALKGAASDGLKKCASQLGVALELYLDDVPAGFKSPSPGPAKRPSAPPQKTAAPPAAAPPSRPAPPAAAPAERPTPPAPPAGASRPNPFTGQGSPNTASVQKPPAPVAPAVATEAPKPAAPPAAAAAATRPNPFGGNDSAKGINTVQMSALTSLAAKKSLSQPDLVALAGVVDEQGAPKQTFDELTHAEAIEVVKAAQR